jgi:hypothetical protein
MRLRDDSLFKYSKQTTSRRSLFSLVTSLLRGEERVESSGGPNLLMCVTTRFESLTNYYLLITTLSLTGDVLLLAGAEELLGKHTVDKTMRPHIFPEVTAMKWRISRPCNQKPESTVGTCLWIGTEAFNS